MFKFVVGCAPPEGHVAVKFCIICFRLINGFIFPQAKMTQRAKLKILLSSIVAHNFTE